MTSTRGRNLALTVLLVAVAVALTACGGSSSSGGSGGFGGKDVSLNAPTTGCGSLQLPKVKDPDGVVAALPASYKKDYNGYATTVHKSPWADFKPKGPPPYKVGVVWGPSTPGFQNLMSDEVLKDLKASPLVGSVDFKTTGPIVNVPAALQNFNSFVAEKVDIIVVEPMVAPPFVGAAQRAFKAGIPVVSVQSAIDSPYVVNVGPNLVLANAESSARLLRMLDGKGNILRLQGIPGAPPDAEAVTGQKAALKECPDAKVVGEAYGNFVTSAAKSETLKFLATHPEKIDGVFQSGTMTDGIMSAFQQSGRPMPIVNDVGPTLGGVNYWANHRKTYHGVGTAFAPQALGAAAASVTLRMLEGQGPKLSVMTAQIPLLTPENLDDWATDPSATFTSVGQPKGPPNSWFTDDYINAFFENGAPPKNK